MPVRLPNIKPHCRVFRDLPVFSPHFFPSPTYCSFLFPLLSAVLFPVFKFSATSFHFTTLSAYPHLPSFLNLSCILHPIVHSILPFSALHSSHSSICSLHFPLSADSAPSVALLHFLLLPSPNIPKVTIPKPPSV